MPARHLGALQPPVEAVTIRIVMTRVIPMGGSSQQDGVPRPITTRAMGSALQTESALLVGSRGAETPASGSHARMWTPHVGGPARMVTRARSECVLQRGAVKDADCDRYSRSRRSGCKFRPRSARRSVGTGPRFPPARNGRPVDYSEDARIATGRAACSGKRCWQAPSDLDRSRQGG